MRIEEQVTINAPRERVWELLEDPSRYPARLDGWVTAFEPHDSDREPGIGARYDIRVASPRQVAGTMSIRRP